MHEHLLQKIYSLYIKYAKPEEKIVCYHCGEKSRSSLTVYVQFDGTTRPVCCQGCAAILRTVEELGMHDEYYAHRISDPNSLEKPPSKQ